MKITSSDFRQMTVNSTNWEQHQSEWKQQEDRFEDIDFTEDSKPVDYTFARAYWIPDYASVMFVKAFLESLQFDFRVYFDLEEDIYMITTNYGGVL